MSYRELVASLAEPTTRFKVSARLRKALPESCDALLEGLVEGPPSVRRWCAKVLDHAPHDSQIEEALRRALTDRNRKVRRAALHALTCAPCKLDGGLASDGTGFLVDGLLYDRSIAVRRSCASALMFDQEGRTGPVVNAFRRVIANDSDSVLRQRVATFLASGDAPREGRVFTEWVVEWRQRIAQLAAS